MRQFPPKLPQMAWTTETERPDTAGTRQKERFVNAPLTAEDLRQALVRQRGTDRRMVDRFLAEADFAADLLRSNDNRPARWAKLIEQALQTVLDVIAKGKLHRLDQAVAQAETILSPIGKAAKRYVVHCVGHAHIDMNWQWSYAETVAVTNDTFTTVLKLMDEFDDFRFTQSQCSVYEIIRQHNPALLKQIQRRVAEGRWEVAAAHWVEGDKNLAAGEALARHLLYSRRYVKEHFDLDPEQVSLDWEPDTFGHAHTIPTIVSGGAVRRYYLWRGGEFEKPRIFWWQGPDGNRVLVFRETTTYNWTISADNAAHMLRFYRESGLKDWMIVYGVGDHGGGPTRRDLLRIRELNSWPIFPSFRCSTAGAYYDTLTPHGEKFPVVDRELNFEFSGCYSSQSAIKKTVRLGENYCIEAESAAALALRALGRPYPSEEIRQAWIDTLFGHFHDILPGSGMAPTRHYHLGMFQKTAATTGMVKTLSYRALAAAVDTSFAQTEAVPEDEAVAMGAGAGRGAMLDGVSAASHVPGGPRPLVVFNPTGRDRREVVTVTVWDTGDEADLQDQHFVAHTSDGNTVPAQRVGHGDYWGHRYVELAFPVAVGSLGYAACVVEPTRSCLPCDCAEPPAGGVTVRTERDSAWIHWHQPNGECSLTNEFLEVHFDKLTGGVSKLLDKTTGVDLAVPSDPLGVLEYAIERTRPSSSWIRADTKRRDPVELDSFDVDQGGPHVGSLVAKGKIGESSVEVTYSLKAGQPWLDIEVRTTWLQRGGPEIGTPRLDMRFPLALTDAKPRYEIPFGSIQRDLTGGETVPALRWAHVQGKAVANKKVAGCCLANDCTYGHSLDGSTLRLTLIRSSYDPDPLPEIGQHTFRMALAPHGRPTPVTEMVSLGSAVNHPLTPIATDIHDGKLVPSARGAEVTPARVILSAVKRCEDEDALIFRLIETAGKDTQANVVLDKALLGTVARAEEVDLLERPIDSSSATPTEDGFRVSLPACGIASVKVAFCP